MEHDIKVKDERFSIKNEVEDDILVVPVNKTRWSRKIFLAKCPFFLLTMTITTEQFVHANYIDFSIFI